MLQRAFTPQVNLLHPFYSQIRVENNQNKSQREFYQWNNKLPYGISVEYIQDAHPNTWDAFYNNLSRVELLSYLPH